jgi:DEAD/DEAH box helicase domain-containing protein
VKRQIVGFKKIKFYSLENIGSGLLNLPEQEMHTTAFWLHFAPEFFQAFAGFTKVDLQDSVRGAGNVLKTVGTVLLLSDARDLAVSVLDDSLEMSKEFAPDIVLYDNYPGGIGQSDPLFRRQKELIAAGLELVTGCACDSGCPSCVGPPNELGPRGKEGARRILASLA